MDAHAEPIHRGIALVTGAGSGIGLALVDALLKKPGTERVYASCRRPHYAAALRDRALKDPRLVPIAMDLTDPVSVQATAGIIADAGRLDLVINTAGILHTEQGMQPERSLKDVNADNLKLAFETNALGTLLLAQALEPLLKKSVAPVFVSLSARVGSIEDNRLGGWYAYRASKAALNMLMKTLAIEWERARPKITCAALHPGTVSTALSDPFTAGTKHHLFVPAEAANNLLDIIDGLQPEMSGSFLAWDGAEIPW